METKTAPYMLIFRDPSPDTYKDLSPEQRQRFMQRWNAWYDDLAAKGKLTQGAPLEREGRVITQVGGRIVDGPFAEAKEAVGGFFMLTVGGIDEATAIGRQCPGLEFGLIVEVRPVADFCPALKTDQMDPASKRYRVGV